MRRALGSLVLAAVLSLAQVDSPAYAQQTTGGTTTAVTSSTADDVFRPETSGVLDGMVNTFKQQMAKWAKRLQAVANNIFLTLATIALVWMGFNLLYAQGMELSQFLHEVVKFMVRTGLFLFLLNNGPRFATLILQSFQQLGNEVHADANPGTVMYGASDLVSAAGSLWLVMMKSLSGFSLLYDPLMILIAAVLLCCIGSIVCVLMGFEVMMATIEAYGVAYGGIFFLGFGGWQATQDKALGYWWTIIASGVYFLGMNLCASLFIGISQATLNQMGALALGTAQNVVNGDTPHGIFDSMAQSYHVIGLLLEYVIEAAICLLLMKRLPKMLASMAGGSGIQGLNMAGMMKTAVTAAAAALTGGAAAAASLAGGASALGGGAAAGGSGAGGSVGGALAGGGAAGPMIPDSKLADGASSGNGGGASQGGGGSASASHGGGGAAAGSGGTQSGAKAALAKANAGLAGRMAAHALMAPFTLAEAMDGKPAATGTTAKLLEQRSKAQAALAAGGGASDSNSAVQPTPSSFSLDSLTGPGSDIGH